MIRRTALVAIALCSFGVVASPNKPDVNIEVRTIDIVASDATLLVKQGCSFHGYRKDETQSIFLVRCDDSIVNLQVSNAEWDIKEFNVRSNMKIDAPAQLSNGTYGVNFKQLSSHIESDEVAMGQKNIKHTEDSYTHYFILETQNQYYENVMLQMSNPKRGIPMNELFAIRRGVLKSDCPVNEGCRRGLHFINNLEERWKAKGSK